MINFRNVNENSIFEDFCVIDFLRKLKGKVKVFFFFFQKSFASFSAKKISKGKSKKSIQFNGV